ncbi:ATP-binding protein [Jannaschia sp. R86511]|uniref:ATP-binding protein n=1 Tax=Jannaschia sp. R86511 TaxID=3093853 RepID=UPI0036D438D1
MSLPDGPAWVAADAADLADAVDALLDNVFAHTPDGSPFAVAVEADGRGYRVVVTDRGPGPGGPEAVERGRSGAGSSGLGLDIARRVSEGSGGRLDLTADALGGTRAVLVLGPPRA